MIDKTYQKELCKRLLKSPNLKKQRLLFKQLAEKPALWIVQDTGIKDILPLNGKQFCKAAKSSDKQKKCINCFGQALRGAKKSRQLVTFVCPAKEFGLCLPLVQGDALYGFLILCHLKKEPAQEIIAFLQALNTVILEKAQKELELSKLYQTIRPRAIALSTIHTIHRLISSSLNLEELLPRIARLSLQILRAKACLISLVDKKTGHLLPKAFINLSKNKAQIHIAHAMKSSENKVLRTGNIILKKSYLCVPLIDEELMGVITVSQKMGKKSFSNFDQEILSALSEQAVGAIKNAQLYKEQENMLLGTVKSISTLLKAGASHSYAHSKAFADIVLGIAKELGLSEQNFRNLRYAAMLHDAEKVGIPEEILKKPAHLTGKEYEIVKEHPKRSAEILNPLERLRPAINIILHHHEKFDGTGYPDKLKGERIPLGARIIAVADSFEAMISRRPYRKSTSISEAIAELKRHSGTQFDPKVIKAFLKFATTKGFITLIKDAFDERT